ncbi:MAG: hypothetical protein ACR2O2_03680 [Ruegeria sp.]
MKVLLHAVAALSLLAFFYQPLLMINSAGSAPADALVNPFAQVVAFSQGN